MLYDVDVAVSSACVHPAVTRRAVVAVQQKADQSNGVCYADISLLVDILHITAWYTPPPSCVCSYFRADLLILEIKCYIL